MGRMTIVILSLSVVVGCTDDEVPIDHEVGITYGSVHDDLVEGTFHTAYGSVEFKSAVVADGVVEVTFDRNHGVFGSRVDWTSLTNDLRFDPTFVVTKDDRFLMKALATTLENDIGNAAPATDNLIRQANLWGHMPEGTVRQSRIVADPQRGWTTLCGVNYRTLYHDTDTHGSLGEYLKVGRYETTNPCRARCGGGCSALYGTSAWTVDCGEHDRCEQVHSGGCGDELWAASDDFSFAGNCNY